jgi:hypothetical protein
LHPHRSRFLISLKKRGHRCKTPQHFRAQSRPFATGKSSRAITYKRFGADRRYGLSRPAIPLYEHRQTPQPQFFRVSRTL